MGEAEVIGTEGRHPRPLEGGPRGGASPGEMSRLERAAVSRWFAPILFAILTLAMFADVPFQGRGRVIGSPQTDLTQHFVASRAFGFGELAKGNLPLWSPRMFSGYPYFGGFQPALLYPPNWVFLVLPLDWAINLSIAAHVFLAGFFTYAWVARVIVPPGADPATAAAGRLGAMLAGVIFMFCGRFFLHVYAGHIPHVCLMPWVPVLLMSIDGVSRGAWRWGLCGAVALALMVLAGYPQMVYYTAVVTPVYVIWRWLEGGRRTTALGGYVLIAVLGTGLCAVQVLAGRDAAQESVRSGGTTYPFAASFSFPPENLLTAVAPGVLGPIQPSDGGLGYFGQAYLWEVSAFVGSAALGLAVVGAAARVGRLPLAMVIVTVLLGLGANTPIHRLLFDWLPGFASFRGSSKFLFLSSLFLAHLSAIGLMRLLTGPGRVWPAAVTGVAAGGLVLLALAVKPGATADGWFTRGLSAVGERAMARQDLYHDFRRLVRTDLMRFEAAEMTSASLLAAAGWMAATAAFLWAATRWPRVALGLGLLACVEVFAFARLHRPVSPMAASPPKAHVDALASMKPGERYVRVPSNYEYREGATGAIPDGWGYDPGVLRRYAELMYRGQDFDPDGARSELIFRGLALEIFRLARITTVLFPNGGAQRFDAAGAPLPEALIVPTARVARGLGIDAAAATAVRDEILAALGTTGFDPSYTVFLEREPAFPIAGRSPVAVEVEQIDTDTRELKFSTVTSGVLLITEAYTRHWRATPLASLPAGQGRYDLQPGDWAFMAIPIVAGDHHIRLDYRPPGYVIGGWISAASTLVLAAGLAWLVRRPPTAAPQ